ncbi:MAG: ATP synthase F1 subunit epsilon [Bacteroidales bacterium]|nr:ATP synthase F1 subunit epsilon [Bacteroidales bacterium]MDY6347965.1 ATP synthase F1 subunit epsilon [Bacteroidales bacterium]
MRIEIISPTTTLFSGEVSIVQLPGIDGSFEILESHAPLVSALDKGKVKVVDDKNEEKFFEINGGVVEVSNNKVLVLAE